MIYILTCLKLFVSKGTEMFGKLDFTNSKRIHFMHVQLWQNYVVTDKTTIYVTFFDGSGGLKRVKSSL